MKLLETLPYYKGCLLYQRETAMMFLNLELEVRCGSHGEPPCNAYPSTMVHTATLRQARFFVDDRLRDGVLGYLSRGGTGAVRRLCACIAAALSTDSEGFESFVPRSCWVCGGKVGARNASPARDFYDPLSKSFCACYRHVMRALQVFLTMEGVEISSGGPAETPISRAIINYSYMRDEAERRLHEPAYFLPRVSRWRRLLNMICNGYKHFWALCGTFGWSAR